MTLLEGEILWNLVWVLPLVMLLFYYAWRKRMSVLKAFLGKRSDNPRYVSVSPTLRFWRAALLAAALFLLFVAAARPSWGVSILPHSGQGHDLMVVFDTSKSMLAQDVRPSRLEHAKWLARQLAEKNPGDRFGLIAFAGHAFLECPLTIDKTSFIQAVNELATDSIPVGGTNLEKALSEAIRGFRAAETSYRAIILITDGDELAGDSSKVLDEIIRLKIPLFILGIGDPSQPGIIQVPTENGGVQTLKDSSGNIVNAPLNEKQLSLLARKTGGIYVRSTTTNPGLADIEARIRKLDVQELDSGKQTRPIERPVFPLLAAFILLCLWFALSEKRFGKVSSAKPLVLIAAMLAGTSLSAQNQAEPPAPSIPMAPPVQENKANPEKTQKVPPAVLYNEGLKAQTGDKDPAKAAALYEQAISSSGAEAEVRSRSCQNLGVMNHQASRGLLQKAQAALQGQQLDQALQQTEASLKQIAATEDIYKESMRDGRDVLSVSRNQQLLLRDRKAAEEFKKKIEELKKQQQEARQNTQKALNQQQKQDQKQKDQQKQDQKQDQNQQGQQQKQDQKQDQQGQQGQQQKQDQKQDQQGQQGQQQKQDQQGQQGQQQKQDQKQDQNQQGQQQKQDQKQDQQGQQGQQQKQDQTQQARESTRELEKQARELNQKNLEDQARKAGEELDQAKDAQNRKDGKEAEKHLKNALDQLGGSDGKDDQNKDQKDQDGKDQKDNKDQKDGKDDQNKDQKDAKDQKDGKDQKDQKDNKDRELPKNDKQSGEGKNGMKEEEKEIDKEQAKALLDLMANDEKQLKDELKERMKRNYGVRPVEKDW